MTIGEKILALRKARGWSQEELAEHIGVTRQAVSRWESDSAKPDADKIVALCEEFGVSADYLLREHYAGEAAPAREQMSATALGQALRALTLEQWAGLFFMLSGIAIIGILAILSKIYPIICNGVAGFPGFLMAHKLGWLFWLAVLGTVTGLWKFWLKPWIAEQEQ